MSGASPVISITFPSFRSPVPTFSNFSFTWDNHIAYSGNVITCALACLNCCPKLSNLINLAKLVHVQSKLGANALHRELAECICHLQKTMERVPNCILDHLNKCSDYRNESQDFDLITKRPSVHRHPAHSSDPHKSWYVSFDYGAWK